MLREARATPAARRRRGGAGQSQQHAEGLGVPQLMAWFSSLHLACDFAVWGAGALERRGGGAAAGAAGDGAADSSVPDFGFRDALAGARREAVACSLRLPGALPVLGWPG